MTDSESAGLSPFKEKIRLAWEREPSDFFGYRMDGGENTEPMARKAGLGNPFCCDYLYIGKNQPDTAVLIEDTDLKKTINDLLKDKGKNSEIIIERLRQENCLKVYGALLILCRLAQRSKKTADELKGKSFSFWLVINPQEDEILEGNVHAIDEIIESLRKKMKDSLGGAKLTGKTEIFPSAYLEQKLCEA